MPSTTTYPTRQLGRNGPHVSAIGYGAMGIGAFYGPANDEQSFKTLTYAANRGITFWDTADIYGGSEKLIGNWFAKTGRRSEVFLATKFGAATYPKINNKPSHIHQQIKKSLANLQTDYIDLYYVHRIDPEVPIEITLETLREYVDSGKVRWIGLSEASMETLRRAKAVPGVGDKVVAAQMEYSLMEFNIEHSGFLKVARELGVSIVAYSPLGRGMLTGRYRSHKDFGEGDFRTAMPRFSEENFPKNLVLVDKVISITQKHNTTPGVVALAWILAEHPDIISIPGTKTVERLEENATAVDLKLSPEHVKELRKLAEEADVFGGRYEGVHLETVEGNTLPLSEWKGEQ